MAHGWLVGAETALLLGTLLMACSSEKTAGSGVTTTLDGSTDASGADSGGNQPTQKELVDFVAQWRIGHFDNGEQFAQNPEILEKTDIVGCGLDVQSADGGTYVLTDLLGGSRPIIYVHTAQPGTEPGTVIFSYIGLAFGAGGTSSTGGTGADAGPDDASSDAAPNDAGQEAGAAAPNPLAALIGACRDKSKLTPPILGALKAARGQPGCDVTLTYKNGRFTGSMPLKTCKSTLVQGGYIAWDWDIQQDVWGAWLRTFTSEGTLVQGSPAMPYFKRIP